MLYAVLRIATQICDDPTDYNANVVITVEGFAPTYEEAAESLGIGDLDPGYKVEYKIVEVGGEGVKMTYHHSCW